jgi:DNA-binding MarR family transcriptional regulator
MVVRLPCYCATLRQAARVISQKYDTALRDLRLTITQFTLLTALQQLPLARSNDLVEMLAMDQTTLSRTLKVMERAGLICRAAGGDRRESRWSLTARGRARWRRALPRWNAAQRDVEKQMGLAEARSLTAAAFNLATRVML